MSSVQIGFIKHRIGTINFEIQNTVKSLNRYHNQGNKNKLNDALIMLEKLKAERAVWFERLAEAEAEFGSE